MELSIWVKPSFTGISRFLVKEVRNTPFSTLVRLADGVEPYDLLMHGFCRQADGMYIARPAVEHAVVAL